MRPPIGSVTLTNVWSRVKPRPIQPREGGWAPPRTRAEVLGVERSAQIVTARQAVSEEVTAVTELRHEAVVEEEDLDEDRRVADHLDVQPADLREDRDPMCSEARG